MLIVLYYLFLTILLSYKKYRCYLRSLIYTFLNCSLINSYTSPLSSLDDRYTFLFLSTNSFFISIAWFCNFFVSILSLVFFPKIWNYLWNFWKTNFLASSLDFAAYYSLSQIFYSSAIFFTSIFLSLLGFLLIFLIFLIFFFFLLSFFFFLFLLL